MPRALVLASLVLLAGLPSLARADALRVDATAETMRVDGSLREWRGAHFATLGSQTGQSARYAIASDARGLYLGVDVDDDALVHRAAVGGASDAVVLTVVDGAGKGARRRDVWLYPGETGRSKSQAAVSTGGAAPSTPDSRVRVVEGPRNDGDGYVLEAFIPFEVLFGADLWEMGRAALRFEDVDPGVRGRVQVSTVDGSEATLPHFLLGAGQHDFVGSLAAAKGRAGLAPSIDLRVNVLGDARPERVVLLDKYLIAYGSGIQDGGTFVYFEVPVESAAAIDELSVVDFDGDGHSELVLRLRQKNALGSRSLYSVLSVRDTLIARVFSAETKKEVGANSLENSLELRDVARGGKRVRLAVLPAKGVSPAQFEERAADDAVPLLVPWGSVRAHTYAFDGARFAMVDEVAEAPKNEPVAAETRGASAALPAPAPAPIAPSHADVLAQFKRVAKLPRDAQPTRVVTGNLCGAAGDETLYVFGNLLVALGPDVGSGRGYAAYGLPVDSQGVRHVGLVDVTGDGNAELFVRVAQPLAGAEGVTRELVIVLRLSADGKFTRALTREVTRRQGERVIANRVSTKDGVLVVEPGTASGWDAASYPFVDEATGGADTLLLPWRAHNVRYTLAGDVLVPR